MELSKRLSILCCIAFSVAFLSCASAQNIDGETKKKIEESKKTNELKIFNNNRYKSIPREVFELTNLRSFSFSGSECDVRPCVNISSLPIQVSKLRNLKHLSLIMNGLKTLPIELNDIQLESLDVSNNYGINVANLNIETLSILNLNDCGLKNLPNNILKMKNLKVLGIEGNTEIPESEINLLRQKLPNCTIYWK